MKQRRHYNRPKTHLTSLSESLALMQGSITHETAPTTLNENLSVQEWTKDEEASIELKLWE
jgi:hypothetical protein